MVGCPEIPVPNPLPGLVWGGPESLNRLLGKAAARRDMGKHGFQERQKHVFSLSYSNRPLSVVSPFDVLDRYLSKGSKSL